MRTRTMPTWTVLPLTGAVVLLAACSTPRPAALDAARADLDRARREEQVSRYAAADLDLAQQRLARADRAYRDIGADEAEHQALLADKQVDVARARAEAAANRAEIATLAQDLATRQTERGTVVTFGDVLFDTGRATLNPGGFQQINRLAAYLANDPQAQVRIEGHTDSTGSAAFNQSLSQRRADAVRDALMAAGVPPQRLTAVGLGEDLPVASNGTAAGRQQNRRVEVVIANAGAAA